MIKDFQRFSSVVFFFVLSVFFVRAGSGQEGSAQSSKAPNSSTSTQSTSTQPISTQPISTPAANQSKPNLDLLAGQWSGHWLSCKNGHHGKLRATFCRLNDCQVQAVFVGSFAKILPFRYKAVLEIIHEEEGLIQLRGSQKLGPIMGTFTYEATISADQFNASYRSRRDCGKWNMSRVPCCH